MQAFKFNQLFFFYILKFDWILYTVPEADFLSGSIFQGCILLGDEQRAGSGMCLKHKMPGGIMCIELRCKSVYNVRAYSNMSSTYISAYHPATSSASGRHISAP